MADDDAHIRARLAGLDSEFEWLNALPSLVAAHGREQVDLAMGGLLTRSQQKECWKRLDAKSARLVWLRSASIADARIIEVALLVTDRALNEVERGVWVIKNELSEADVAELRSERWSDDLVAEVRSPSSLSCVDASAKIVAFLANYCTQGTVVLAGTSLARDYDVLERKLPAVASFLSPTARVDLGCDGVIRYAELAGKSLLAEPNIGSRVREFEAEHRRKHACRAQPSRAMDDIEASVVALGWVREHLFAPPKAATYVMMGLASYAVIMVASLISLVLNASNLAVDGHAG